MEIKFLLNNYELSYFILIAVKVIKFNKNIIIDGLPDLSLFICLIFTLTLHATFNLGTFM